MWMDLGSTRRFARFGRTRYLPKQLPPGDALPVSSGRRRVGRLQRIPTDACTRVYPSSCFSRADANAKRRVRTAVYCTAGQTSGSAKIPIQVGLQQDEAENRSDAPIRPACPETLRQRHRQSGAGTSATLRRAPKLLRRADSRAKGANLRRCGSEVAGRTDDN